MRFASLGSGSRGNATVVSAGGTTLLLDCGLSLRELTRRLALLGLQPADLDAVLVTHEHSDHCTGVATLARRCNLPVYLTHGTLASGRIGDCPRLLPFRSGEDFRIGALQVESVAVPHDAREPCQFRFTHRNTRLGVLTDLGSLPPPVVAHYRGCDALLLEFNHDLELLRQGAYPPALKARVGGDRGHLNNHQAAGLLAELGTRGLQHLVLAHISEKNNREERVQAALAPMREELEGRVHLARQDTGTGGWLSLA